MHDVAMKSIFFLFASVSMTDSVLVESTSLFQSVLDVIVRIRFIFILGKRREKLNSFSTEIRLRAAMSKKRVSLPLIAALFPLFTVSGPDLGSKLALSNRYLRHFIRGKTSGA